MTILITGGTGLVGSRLVPRLAKAGIRCRALARAGGSTPNGAEVVHGDLFDEASLARAVEGVSAIVHFAAVFRTPDEALVYRSNVDGTRHLIAAAQAHAPNARFIMASTTNVYNADGARPSREGDPVAPEQAYPASKLLAEEAVRASGLKWSVLRLGFVYGDGDGHIAAIPEHARKGQWHPARKMSVIHHRDVANAVLLALDGAMDGRVVNIVDDAAVSLYELTQLSGGELEPSSEPLVNPWHLHVDGALGRRLGFLPSLRSVYEAERENAL